MNRERERERSQMGRRRRRGGGGGGGRIRRHGILGGKRVFVLGDVRQKTT